MIDKKRMPIIVFFLLISFFYLELGVASGAPTVTITTNVASPTKNSPIPITATFSENVTDFAVGDISVGNGAAENFVAVSETVYNFDATPSGQGIVTVDIPAGVAQDSAGNGNTAATQFNIIYDSVQPTATITSTATSPTKNSPIPITATFSETITDFAVGDISVGNGATNNFVAVSGTVYTFDVTPSGEGTLTVDIPAGVAQDSAGNGNTAAAQFSIIYDSVQPTATITSTATSPTKNSPIPITATFSETITDFAVGDISVGNGATNNFVAVSGTVYTFDVTPSGEGTLTVDIPAGVAQDSAGNGNTAAAQFSIIYDSVQPTATITSTATSPTKNSPIPITATFSETITDFAVGDISVGNGATNNFVVVSGTVYTFDVTPSGEGTLTVDIPAGVAQDSAGNGNTAAAQFSIIYDSVQPTVTITSTFGSPTRNSLIPITATFSKSVTGFAVSDINVGNGTANNFVAVSETVYTFDITPSGEGTVTVDIPAGVAQDSAGNGNTAAQFSIIYDNIQPTVAITSTATSPTKNSPIPITATFSETITGFAVGGINVGNGTANNFVMISGTVYTFDVTPSGEGTVTVDIPAGVAQDSAGNGNTAAQFSIIYDSVQPTATITSTATSPTKNSPIPITATFSETITGFAVGDINVGNGTAENFVAVSGNVYTFDLIPSGQGIVTVDIPAGVAQDSAGNGNTAATQFNIIYDSVQPSATITSIATSPTKNSPIPITATFSETITGFAVGDINVGNGTANNFVVVSETVYTFDVTPSGQGIVTVDIPADVAQDSAGNGNIAATRFSIIYDSAQPTVTISSPASGDFLNITAIAVGGTANDIGSGLQKVEVKVDNSPYASANVSGTSWSFTTSTLTDGTHTMSAKATDNAGNTAEISISITIDTVLPTISITSPLNGQVFTISPITVNGTASDNMGLSKVEVKVGNGDWQNASKTASWSLQVTLSEGLNMIYARATDISGNTKEASINVTLDTTPPASVSNPQTPTSVGSFYINNSWTNPPDEDFGYVLFKYSNGTDLINVNNPTNYLNILWSPHYTQNISAQTVDIYSNINPTKIWFNSTIPNNRPVQAPIGNKEIYKGQKLTFSISATDVDSDTITYGTNATKGSLNNITGEYTWTPGDSDAGEYVWELYSTDDYNGIDRETIRITVKNPLDIELEFIEPYVIKDDNGTFVEIWRDANKGHIGKFIGYNATFKNIGIDSMIITINAKIYNNRSDNQNSETVSLIQNQTKSCPDNYRWCRFGFEIDSSGVKDGHFKFTLQVNVKGYNGSNFVFNYDNSTTISLPVIPIYKIKRANGDVALVTEDRTTPIIYTLEANSNVNLTEISISDFPLFSNSFNDISKLVADVNGSRCYNGSNLISCSKNYTYQAKTSDLSKFKCEDDFPCIINMATLTAKTDSGIITDTDYSELINIPVENKGEERSGRGNSGSSGGGGGGMASGEDFKNIERREVREMSTLGGQISAYVFKSADPVMAVSFESSVSENWVPVAVEVLKNRSKSAGENGPGEVYKYFNIFVGMSGFSKKVKNGVVVYRVNNSWLNENGLDPGDIRLYKWEGKWVEKVTEIVETKPNQTYYASLTGNFSTFAIAGVKKSEFASTSVANNNTPGESDNNISQTSAEPSSTIDKWPATLSLILGIMPVIGIIGLVYYLKFRKHKI